MQDVHNLINIGLTNLIQILNQDEKILYVSFKWCFWQI